MHRLPQLPAPRASAPPAAAPEPSVRSQWERVVLDPDIELHVRRPLTRQHNKQVERLIAIARELSEGGLTMPCRNIILNARTDRRFIRSTYRSNRFVLAEIKAPHAHVTRQRSSAGQPRLRPRPFRLDVGRKAPPGQGWPWSSRSRAFNSTIASPSSSTTTPSTSSSSRPGHAGAGARAMRALRHRGTRLDQPG